MVYALINLKLQHSHLPSPLFHTPRWDIFEPCLVPGWGEEYETAEEMSFDIKYGRV